MSSACGNCQAESQARASDLTQFTYKSFNHSISRLSYVHSSRTTDESLLFRPFTFFLLNTKTLSLALDLSKCNTHTHTLLVDLPMHFDFPGRKCMHQSLSLSLSLFPFAKTGWIQIRPEWNSGKNVSSI